MTPLRGTSRAVIRGITAEQFYNAFESSWHPIHGPGGVRPHIGLAVSGGVDSMALAQLCQMVEWGRGHEYSLKPRFHAFIVDHKAREGSSQEAQLTALRLEQLRIRVSILPLQWPYGADPTKLTNFETEARRLRYQALGRACAQLKIRRLLLAHHNDDQTETVLMQMLTPGRSRSSMGGMPAKGNIPECWGIHGAHESGLEEATCTVAKFNKFHEKLPPRPDVLRGHIELGIEDGGIIISRPLLRFSKDELRQTCIENRVEWIEDQTNQRPTLTKRNAVRLLLGSGQLPKALSKEALLGLRAKSIFRAAGIQSRAAGLFGKFRIITFDARCGSMVARPPARIMATHNVPEKMQKQKRWEAVERACQAIRCLLSTISPLETVDKRKLGVAVNALFPDTLDTAKNPGKQTIKFTVAGVLCERKDAPVAEEETGNLKNLDQEHIWTFSRQPLTNGKARPTIQIFPTMFDPAVSSQHELGSEMTVPEDRSMTFNMVGWSPFHLWDGRFWIRMQNRTPHTLLVRPFQPSDMQHLRNTLPKEPFKQLRATLAVAAPGDIRWTLPVVVIPASSTTITSSPPSDPLKDSSSDPQDIPICLPTLGSTLTSPAHCITETRFRKVDFGRHVPASKPSSFRTTDLDFVITRSSAETEEEKRAKQRREIRQAKKHAKNVAWKRLRKEEKAEMRRLEAEERKAAGVVVDGREEARSEEQTTQQAQPQWQDPQPRYDATEQDARLSKILRPRSISSPSMQLREGYKADTRLYQDFSRERERENFQAREIVHEDYNVGGGGGENVKGDDADDDEEDGVILHQSPHSDPWRSFTPRQQEVAVGAGVAVEPGNTLERRRPLRREREKEREVEDVQDKWQEREHWREWI